jgi:hypothetical protein
MKNQKKVPQKQIQEQQSETSVNNIEHANTAYDAETRFWVYR